MYHVIKKDSYLIDISDLSGMYVYFKNALEYAEQLKSIDGKQYDIVRVETVYTTQTLDEEALEALDAHDMADA